MSDNTYYSYAVYSYNGSGVTTNYSTALSGSQITQAISAPISNASSNVTTTDFIANWSAVSGATGYSLDVNTTANFPFTENFQRCLLGTTTTSDGNDISNTVNNYMQSSGWSSLNIFQAGGSVRMGYTGALGDLITPTIDLSSNGGNATLTFDCNVYSTDGSATYQVWHAPDGKNFTQVGTDLTAPSSLTNVSFSISGGTASSKIKIATSTISKRILIDNIKIYQVNTIAGYDNLSVSGTSLDVTGLTPGINYYYRVRAVDANGTSVNSGIVSETVQSQTITFGALSTVTYGDAPFTVSATGGGSGYPVIFTSSDPTVATCTGTNGSKVTILKAGSCTIYADQNGITNYYNSAPEVSQTLTVNPKALTIIGLSGVNKVYDGTTTAAVTGTSYSGLVNGDSFSVMGTPVANFADATVGNGKAITVTGYTAPTTNYSLTQPTGLTANIYPTTSTWNSSGSADWATSANWTYLPLAATDVVVATGELSINQSQAVHSITVNPGAKLTLNSGTLTANSITLQSDPTGVLGNGTYVDLGTTAIPTASVQQYLTVGRNWYISSPVSGSTGNVVLGTAGNNLWQYNEVNSDWTTDVTSTSTPLTVMKGFVANTVGGVLNFTGPLNSGPQSITLNRTDNSNPERGYNLAGNPYPSYLDWTKVYTASSDIDPTMWYRTKTGSVYEFDTFNAVSGVGTNNVAVVTKYIPPMQAFWVLVTEGNPSGTLEVDNTMRSHDATGTNLLKTKALVETTQSVLRLQVSNGTNSDEAIVLFNTNATNGYDKYDSPKMTNNNKAIPEIYTIAGTKQVVINGMNSIAADEELPLGFTTGQSNTFTIKATEISNFDADAQIILKDNLLNTQQNLTVDSTYSFTSEVASTVSRFSLIFKSPAVSTGLSHESNDQNILIYKNGNNQITIQCSGNLNSQSTVVVSNAIGQKLVSKQLTSNLTVIDSYLRSGVYLVTVTNAGKTTTQKVILN